MINIVGELVAEGKTKRLYSTKNDDHLAVEYIDNSINYHGKHLVAFEGKGALVNNINSIIMKQLEANGISTHYMRRIDSNKTLVRRAEMIPIEVVVHNYSAGSMCSRLGLKSQQKFKSPILEFCYKNDKLRDPVINEYHAYAMGLCSKEEMAAMCFTASRINKILSDMFAEHDMVVADFKLEFGRVRGRLVVADEISPSTARFWDKQTLAKLCNDGKDMKEEYTQILQRLSKKDN